MNDSWLRTLREYDGATQCDVAEALGVSERTYQRWEASPDDLPLWRVWCLLAELDPDHDVILVPDPDGWRVVLAAPILRWARDISDR